MAKAGAANGGSRIIGGGSGDLYQNNGALQLASRSAIMKMAASKRKWRRRLAAAEISAAQRKSRHQSASVNGRFEQYQPQLQPWLKASWRHGVSDMA
jgi:hypothetical protein